MGLSEEQCLELQKMPPVKGPVIEQKDGRWILATYRGGVRTIHGQVYQTLPLRTAVTEVMKLPGDQVCLLDDQYWPTPSTCLQDGDQCDAETIVIKDIQGTPDRPVVIKGFCSRPVLNGGTTPLPYWWDRPSTFFRFENCQWIVIEGLSVKNCWPLFMYLDNSAYITVRDLHVEGSTYVIWAQGEGCHHLLIEDNVWQQDPSGVLWNELIWTDVHDNEYQYYDGGFFGSKAITGSLIVRRNVFRNGFNAVRMKADPKTGLDRHNLNVEIYDNVFDKLRDNAVEPEEAATNWYIYHNQFKDIHAPISLDRVACGYYLIFGNLFWFTERGGQMIDPYTGGKVYKIKGKPPYITDRKLHTFNNSLYMNSKLIKSGNTQYFIHLNNAVQFCDPDDYEDCLCMPVNNFVAKDFNMIQDVVFDYDITNGTLSRLKAEGQEQNGIADPEFTFLAPEVGDFHASPDYAIPEGTVVKLEPKEDWAGTYLWESRYDDKPPKRGAWQSEEELIDGPPFAFYRSDQTPDDYQEHPRIVRVIRQPSCLAIYFSTPVASRTDLIIRLINQTTGQKVVLPAHIHINQLAADMGSQVIDWISDALVLISPDIHNPDTNLHITTWASVDKKVLFEPYESA